MRFALIRHAEAESESSATLGDFGRAITPVGRRQAADLAGWLRTFADPLGQILVSPLVRTVQTAEVLASVGFQGNVSALDALRPGQPASALLDLIDRLPQGGALVGHEPILSDLGAALLNRDSLPFGFQKAACLLLEGGPDGLRFVAYRVPFGDPVTSL